MPLPKPIGKGSAYQWIGDPNNPRNLDDTAISFTITSVENLSTSVLPIKLSITYPDRSAFALKEDKGIGDLNYWNYIQVQTVPITAKDVDPKNPNFSVIYPSTLLFYPDGTNVFSTNQTLNTVYPQYWKDLPERATVTDSGTTTEYSFNVSKEEWQYFPEYNGQPPTWSATLILRARVICVKEWPNTDADSYVNPDIQDVILAAGPWFQTMNTVTTKINPTNKQNTATENTEDAGTSDLPASNVSMTKLRTNLPVAKNATASLTNPSGLGTVKWRHGLIHTWENTPADGAFPDQIPYGFRFHYNPASWAQSVSFTENINADALAASQMDRLPLPGGFASISFSLFLNRIVDLAMVGDIYKLGIPPAPNGVIADPNSPPPDAQAIASLANTMSTMYDEARQGVGVPSSMVGYVSNLGKTEHIQRIIRQGTLYDLDFLYASANGRALGSFHVHGPGVTNPSYIGDGWLPSDYGYIAPRFVRVWLGPYITFVGRINNIDVQHLLFTQYMVPTFTQVNITMTRGLTFGKDTADAKTLFNSNSSALGIANTSTEGNQTSTGTVGQ